MPKHWNELSSGAGKKATLCERVKDALNTRIKHALGQGLDNYWFRVPSATSSRRDELVSSPESIEELGEVLGWSKEKFIMILQELKVVGKNGKKVSSDALVYVFSTFNYNLIPRKYGPLMYYKIQDSSKPISSPNDMRLSQHKDKKFTRVTKDLSKHDWDELSSKYGKTVPITSLLSSLPEHSREECLGAFQSIKTKFCTHPLRNNKARTWMQLPKAHNFKKLKEILSKSDVDVMLGIMGITPILLMSK